MITSAELEHDARLLLLALHARSAETCAHCRRVAAYAVRIGQQMQLGAAQLGAIYYGALLHDIGKLSFPDAGFAPRRLTDAERTATQLHPVIGAQLLAAAGFPADVVDCVAEHHEWVDGTGYPAKRGGAAISLPARVCAVADAYDAMTADRCYRKALSHDAATREITACAGTQFDLRVVTAFLHIPAAELHHAGLRQAA